MPAAAVVRTAGVGFATDGAAGVTAGADANDGLAVGAIAAGETGVVGFKLADDGNVEGTP